MQVATFATTEAILRTSKWSCAGQIGGPNAGWLRDQVASDARRDGTRQHLQHLEHLFKLARPDAAKLDRHAFGSMACKPISRTPYWPARSQSEPPDLLLMQIDGQELFSQWLQSAWSVQLRLAPEIERELEKKRGGPKQKNGWREYSRPVGLNASSPVARHRHRIWRIPATAVEDESLCQQPKRARKTSYTNEANQPSDDSHEAPSAANE